MQKKMDQALALHDKGFNCAQAVGIPFAEALGMSASLAAKALEGFGAGMGGRDQACGALSGAIFAAGLKYADGNLQAPASKMQTYAVCKELCDQFTAYCGTAICKEIKAQEKVSCAECIQKGIELAYHVLYK